MNIGAMDPTWAEPIPAKISRDSPSKDSSESTSAGCPPPESESDCWENPSIPVLEAVPTIPEPLFD